MIKALAVLALLAACGGKTEPQQPTKKDDGGVAKPAEDAAANVTLAPAPPLPVVPAGLPPVELPATVTPEAVALGELLFWDSRLSIHGKQSCATCHDPAHGYASAKRMETAAGKLFPRRAPTLVNLAWHKELGWDGRYSSMGEFLDAHVKNQLGDDLGTAVARIAEVPGYRAHFTRVGGVAAAADALAAFTLTRYAGSTWDRVERNPDAPANLKAGYTLFQNKAQCSVCHTPPLYTDLRFHRMGLVASPDEGRGRVDAAAKGAFKTPSLRGVATRTGFFHDASAASLDAAIDWHLAGGTGQGADPSIVDPALKKLVLTAAEREQLAAFVQALSDDQPAAKPPTLP
ncbi:MAG: cytochrome c peroxidase [Kofleriaceae bacterium]